MTLNLNCKIPSYDYVREPGGEGVALHPLASNMNGKTILFCCHSYITLMQLRQEKKQLITIIQIHRTNN